MLRKLLLIVIFSFLIFYKSSGTLFLVGGGPIPDNVKTKFLQLAGDKIVVINAASSLPVDFWSPSWVNFKNVSDLEDATAVWFAGGDQKKLVSECSGLVDALWKVYNRGGVIGGTSAGASAVSSMMIYEGMLIPGFGFLDLIVDQHFDTRKRFARLKKVVKESGRCGIGIDESTAIIISNKVSILGVGGVTFICPLDI